MEKSVHKLYRLRSHAHEERAKALDTRASLARAGSVATSVIQIKRECLDEEFKEYAETAMNEMLGWYGYNNNNCATTPKRQPQQTQNNSRNSNGHNGHQQQSDDDEPNENMDHIDRHNKTDNGHVAKNHMDAHVLAHQQPLPTRKSSGNSSGSDSPKANDICAWCGMSVEETIALASSDAIFCSEMCFSQSRRANFKRNKTCDWCKHVRHTVSYVDFQDGASQLQFCSDKCLNQYKMHIFCRETRAHLEMHPHLLDGEETSAAALITPDLWLRNCKSPAAAAAGDSHPPSPSPTISMADAPQTSPLPLISVARPSKLLARSHPPPATVVIESVPPVRRKRLRKRCAVPVAQPKPAVEAQDLRVRPPPTLAASTPYVDGRRDFPELASRLFANGGPPANGFHSHRMVRNGMLQPPPPPPPPLPPPPPSMQPLFNASANELPYRNAPFARPPAGIVPPVTVMVPYPVVLPVPVPIPIPLPLSVFFKAAMLKQRIEQGAANPHTLQHTSAASRNERDDDDDDDENDDDNGDEEIVVDDEQQRKNSTPCNDDDDRLVIDETQPEENGVTDAEDENVLQHNDNVPRMGMVPMHLRKRKHVETNGNGNIQHLVCKPKNPLSV